MYFRCSYGQAIGVDIVDYHYHLRLRKYGVPTAKGRMDVLSEVRFQSCIVIGLLSGSAFSARPLDGNKGPALSAS